jgi:hypothetical protein
MTSSTAEREQQEQQYYSNEGATERAAANDHQSVKSARSFCEESEGRVSANLRARTSGYKGSRSTVHASHALLEHARGGANVKIGSREKVERMEALKGR